MREKIHPNYKETAITCTCGNVIETSSTKQNLKIEVCSNCHPFYTGKQKLLDTAGRVEKFQNRQKATAAKKAAKVKKEIKEEEKADS
jgi:large subunit ribosomal protein L31